MRSEGFGRLIDDMGRKVMRKLNSIADTFGESPAKVDAVINALTNGR